MRDLSPGFAAHLKSGATTLCHCWLVERADGTKIGFTDHDDRISFDGLTFEPQSGFSSSEGVASLNLGVDTSEIVGALQSDVISDEALHAGDYDNARVIFYTVNWQSPDQRVVLRHADLGEVTCQDGVFRAELRGLTHRLNQRTGRLFENACDADLGDSRCRVDLDQSQFKRTGTVVEALDTRTLLVSGLTSFATNWFTRGLLTWIDGDNAGRSIEIANHIHSGSNVQLTLWTEMPDVPRAGDRFEVIAGCDKLSETCRNKFQNITNFRGFPHMPGNDFAYRVAKPNGRNTGERLTS